MPGRRRHSRKPELMDPTDSGQGQEKPSEQLLPLSSTGRQRKKNSRFDDYETVVQKTPRKCSGRGRRASKATPAKTEEAAADTEQTSDGQEEALDKTTPESDGKTVMRTRRKSRRGRKPAAKKTPTKESPARKTCKADGSLVPNGGGGVVDTVQQENGTPKPKRKYVRKQVAQKATPVTEAPQEEHPPEEEVEPGGRRRRSAAKAALKYLQILAKDALYHPNDETESGANSKDVTAVRRGRKRKRASCNSDAEDDEDFVPGADEDEVEAFEDEAEEEEEEEDLDSDLEFGKSGRCSAVFRLNKGYTGHRTKSLNGLSANLMNAAWNAFETTKKFREGHYSSWVFPEWIPSSTDWTPVPQSDLEKYLPQELHSAAFKVSREGFKKEETSLQSLDRFEALPAHLECWDTALYAGGPVWAMEWCPTPDGAPATQYIAVSCHRDMDEQHYASKTYAGPGLIQLWDVGKLQYDSSPDSPPALAYGLAQDKGVVWSLRWCPAGGWELPSCARKAPFLPRLGLLAAATSSGVVTIYSLPHPDALHSNEKARESGKASKQLPIYQAEGVVTLKLGSLKAPHHDNSGQALTMDWLPEKPHNIIAIGFYDGIVGLWNLCTQSTLLQVRESDTSLSLLPYRCFVAHDNTVRTLAFCPASRHLLVTAGEDRHVKTWDLKRLDDPIMVQKRYVTNEICWPLNSPGYLLAQDTGYVARGSQGVHYFDHSFNSFFPIPRTGTVWSVSYTDWLNSVASSDSLGEVVLAVLPQITCCSPVSYKRTIDVRFPIYFTSLVPYDATEGENQEGGGGGEEEEGEAAEEREEGDAGRRDAGSEGGNENDNENGRGQNNKSPPLQFHTFQETVKKYCLHHTDSDMRSFTGNRKGALWKRMQDTEYKGKVKLEEMPLTAVHKVRFSPNMSCHTWLASGGQAGLIRLNCLRSMINPQVKDMIGKNQAQFNALYSPKQQEEAAQTATEPL